MDNNTRKYDSVAEYRKMSTKQLETAKAFWVEVLTTKYTYPAAVNELELIRMILAERIGKK